VLFGSDVDWSGEFWVSCESEVGVAVDGRVTYGESREPSERSERSGVLPGASESRDSSLPLVWLWKIWSPTHHLWLRLSSAPA
jgi:hypothetical protein